MKFISVTIKGEKWCINTAYIVAIKNDSGKATISFTPDGTVGLPIDQTYEEVMKLLQE
jgi:hypothetical protein